MPSEKYKQGIIVTEPGFPLFLHFLRYYGSDKDHTFLPPKKDCISLLYIGNKEVKTTSLLNFPLNTYFLFRVTNVAL